MDTASFRTLKRDDIPRALGIMIRFIPYLIAVASLCLAVAFAAEAHAPRGTFAFIARSGVSTSALTWFAFLCGVAGLLWHWARRSLFWSCALCTVTCAPMIVYSYFGTIFLTSEVQGSYATLVMFWTCCAVCILFVAFTVLLAAWIEVSKFAERMHG